MSQSAAMAGIEKQLRDRIALDRLVIVMAHFPDQMVELEEMLQRSSVSYRTVHEWLDGPTIDRQFDHMDSATVLLARSDAIADGEQEAAQDRDTDRSISIFFREHHPLASMDRRVERFAASMRFATRLEFHASLDDDLMRVFSGEWIRGILEGIGMKEDEAIESKMVARRIRGAQQKVKESYELARKTGQGGSEWQSTDRRAPD
ncbi:MAG: hypothetical protein HQ581_18045 [Planctomycetes bacterium]|nr:hypothetical protein [Planctomycetota bacterium]